MEQESSFRFFSKSFLIILLCLFLSSFGVVLGLLEYYFNTQPNIPHQILLKAQSVKKTSAMPVRVTEPTERESVLRQNEATSFGFKVTKNPDLKSPDAVILKSEDIPVLKDEEDFVLESNEEKNTVLSADFKKELIKKINKGECFQDYLTLQKRAVTDAEKLLLKRLTPFCLETHTPPLKEFEKTFLKAEQKALVQYHKQTQTGFSQKIKIALTYLVHIRKEHPETEEIPDLLNAAQNAIRQGNLEDALDKIEKLPTSLRPFFASFHLQVNHYLELIQLLKE